MSLETITPNRGPDTIVDKSVRKVWQLPGDQVRIGGRSWPDHLAGILTQVTAGLGCAGMHVSAELYKLLVYDTGGFFLSHRDTEKTEGMFGTLVVVAEVLRRRGRRLQRGSLRIRRVRGHRSGRPLSTHQPMAQP